MYRSDGQYKSTLWISHYVGKLSVVEYEETENVTDL